MPAARPPGCRRRPWKPWTPGCSAAGRGATRWICWAMRTARAMRRRWRRCWPTATPTPCSPSTCPPCSRRRWTPRGRWPTRCAPARAGAGASRPWRCGWAATARRPGCWARPGCRPTPPRPRRCAASCTWRATGRRRLPCARRRPACRTISTSTWTPPARWCARRWTPGASGWIRWRWPGCSPPTTSRSRPAWWRPMPLPPPKRPGRCWTRAIRLR